MSKLFGGTGLCKHNLIAQFCPHCEVEVIQKQLTAAKLDTTWQQGAEAFRKAVMHVCAPYTHGQWFMEAIRTLPVPERKEG